MCLLIKVPTEEAWLWKRSEDWAKGAHSLFVTDTINKTTLQGWMETHTDSHAEIS